MDLKTFESRHFINNYTHTHTYSLYIYTIWVCILKHTQTSLSRKMLIYMRTCGCVHLYNKLVSKVCRGRVINQTFMLMSLFQTLFIIAVFLLLHNFSNSLDYCLGNVDNIDVILDSNFQMFTYDDICNGCFPLVHI